MWNIPVTLEEIYIFIDSYTCPFENQEPEYFSDFSKIKLPVLSKNLICTIYQIAGKSCLIL